MIRVAACEPELPPLEMIRGTKRARTTASLDLVLEVAHRRRGEHLADEEDDQPGGPLANHLQDRRGDVRLVQGLEAAEHLDLAGRLLLGHVEHVVERDDADQPPSVVHHGKRRAVVLPEDLDGILLGVGGLEADDPVVAQVRHHGMERRQKDLADPQVIDEAMIVVQHVDDVQGLAVAPVGPDVVEHVADRPVLADGHVVGGHEPADTAFVVGQQCPGDLALVGIEHRDQPLGLLRGELGQKGGPVVGRHVVEQAGRLALGDGFQHRKLALQAEVGESLGGEARGEQPERPDPLAGREMAEKLPEVSRQPPVQDLAERAIVALLDEFSDLGKDQLAQHRRTMISNPGPSRWTMKVTGREESRRRADAQGR